MKILEEKTYPAKPKVQKPQFNKAFYFFIKYCKLTVKR